MIHESQLDLKLGILNITFKDIDGYILMRLGAAIGNPSE